MRAENLSQHRYKFFQCRLNVKGKGEDFKERPHWCRAGKSWYFEKNNIGN